LSLGGGARVLIPRAWQQIRYQGVPATVVYPIVFLTDGRLAGRCVNGPPGSACTGQAWFAPHWTTPSNGVLLSWLNVTIPGPATDRHFLSYVHARTVTVAHRPAKIVRGPVTSCPTGTTLEIDAYIQQSRTGYPGDRLDMRACLGAHAPATTRHAVMRMLHSLRFGRHG
jgi:hypothetical protein